MLNNSTTIAAFIGARLQHPIPEYNSCQHRISTIRVEQYKSKFNEVRVYCSIAHIEELAKAAEENGSPGIALDMNFQRGWLFKDIEHYRRTYFDMCALLDYKRNDILSSADYRLFLCKDESELDKMISKFNDITSVKTTHALFEDYNDLREVTLHLMQRVPFNVT